MEIWGPWTTFLRKSGGTITGNLQINGTLDVLGNTDLADTEVDNLLVNNTLEVTQTSVFNDDVELNGQMVIIHDDTLGLAPHLILKDATGAGVINQVAGQVSGGGLKGTFYSGNGGVMCILPQIGGEVEMPSTFLEPEPLWKVPLLAEALTPRRMLMLHSMMYGL